MIIPGKHIMLANCLLNVGATILEGLKEERTISNLWDGVRLRSEIVTFERFTLGLDMLFTLGLVRYNRRGLMEKSL